MPSLPELQTAVSRALIQRDEPVLTGWIRGGRGPDAEARIDVYRANVLGNYRYTLREVYPVVLAPVGKAFFHRAVDDYVLRHPSRSGDLNDFGGKFGDFLAAWAPVAELTYLPDVARLEWAIERVFHAADTPPLDLRRFAAVPPAMLPALRFKLRPASRIVRSVFPILRIWQVNHPGFSGDQKVHLDTGGDDLLVIRRTMSVAVERLSAGELALIEALAANLPLGQAHARAEEAEPGLDLAQVLQRHVLGGTLIAFREHDGESA